MLLFSWQWLENKNLVYIYYLLLFNDKNRKVYKGIIFKQIMTDQRRLNVLVADDEPAIRNLLVSLISRIPNLDVRTAADGQEAYDRIKELTPDILCTDVMMPSMHGGQLLEKLALEGYKIPNFVITGTPITSEAALAAFYSRRMYSEEQARLLNLPFLQPTFDAQMQHMAEKDVDSDFGFNVLIKPKQVAKLLPRMKELQETIYGQK